MADRSVPDDVFCRYKWIERTPETSGVSEDRWNVPNVTQILSEKEIGSDPVRIQLTGQLQSPSQHLKAELNQLK